MSDNFKTSDSKPKDGSFSGRTFKRTGFQFLGLGLQDIIRYFFGGNAAVAIIVLILICLFLGNEAARFFPDHHQDLKSYRLSGQEFVDYMGDEVAAHTNLYGAANIAYYAEVNRTSREEDNILRAQRSLVTNVENLAGKTLGRLERELDRIEELEEDLEDLDERSGVVASADSQSTSSTASDTDEAASESGVVLPESAETEVPEAILAERAEIEAAIISLQGKADVLRAELEEKVEKAVRSDVAWEFDASVRPLTKEQRENLREATVHELNPDAEGDHPYIAELKQESRAKKKAAAEELSGFKDTLKELQAAIRPLKLLHGDLRSIGMENKSVLTSFSTAGSRRAALLEGAENAKSEEARAEMLSEAEAVVIEEPDYAALNVPMYAAVTKHSELSTALEAEMERIYPQLPDEFETKSGRENMNRSQVYYERFQNTLKESRVEVVEWRHDEPLSAVESVSAFLFGKNWITNSSWHDFYGLLPIFTGSLLISIIALTVAVPFAVSAAIYVNQLAPHREQNLIKPAIEFIEAIPSVVLGFFGILVFGETLRTVSQVEWLQWVPGFPMSERLTILNAGLLLALMAVPTIFTLTEDALNNIPGALAENSLAMGATKLQTVFRVVVPASLSGLIAAILLGFGRIVGETMVVLLVAGNKIKIPDFTEGIGVITQPAHTMTGIIAQELGEVDSGSIHWRALFMVGMVLFAISLLVNFSAQQVLKKLQKI